MIIDDVATAGKPAATSARKLTFLQKERWKAIQKARRKGCRFDLLSGIWESTGAQSRNTWMPRVLQRDNPGRFPQHRHLVPSRPNRVTFILNFDNVIVLRFGHLLTVQRKCHPMRELTLNQQEQARIKVLNSVLEYHLPIAQAAQIMGVSERHTKRLLAAYRRDGPAAVAHGNRGRKPHNAVPEAEAAAVAQFTAAFYS